MESNQELQIKQHVFDQEGISKRLILSILLLKEKRVESALYQLSTVVDSTSKIHFPTETPTNRYCNYLQKNFQDLLKLATLGKEEIVLNGSTTKIDRILDIGLKNTESFSQILYKIRNSLYHHKDPISNIVHFSDTELFGISKDEKIILSTTFVYGILLLLLTDEKNITRISPLALSDNFYIELNDKVYYYRDYIGKREDFLELLINSTTLDYLRVEDFHTQDFDFVKINVSGITKRMFLGLTSISDQDFENALFEILSVAEFMASLYYPDKGGKTDKKKLNKFISDNHDDINQIHTFNKPSILGVGKANEFNMSGSQVSDFTFFAKDVEYVEVFTNLRRSFYHDPQELVNRNIYVTNRTRNISIKNGELVIDPSLVQAIFWILWTDKKIISYIDIDNYKGITITSIKGKKTEIIDLIGNRKKLLDEFYSN